MSTMTTTVTTRDGARYTFAPDFASVSVEGIDRALLSPPSVDMGFRMLLTYTDGGHDLTEHVSEVSVAGDAPENHPFDLPQLRKLARQAR